MSSISSTGSCGPLGTHTWALSSGPLQYTAHTCTQIFAHSTLLWCEEAWEQLQFCVTKPTYNTTGKLERSFVPKKVPDQVKSTVCQFQGKPMIVVAFRWPWVSLWAFILSLARVMHIADYVTRSSSYLEELRENAGNRLITKRSWSLKIQVIFSACVHSPTSCRCQKVLDFPFYL